MDLVKGFTDGNAALFKLNLHQWQAVYQQGYVIAVFMSAGLFKLLDDLQFVASKAFFIKQIDILQVTVIKGKVINIVAMHLFGFINDGVAWGVKVLLSKAPPFSVAKFDVIQPLQLIANVNQHFVRGVKRRQKLIALVGQVLNQLIFKLGFSLIAVVDRPLFGVGIKHNIVVRFSDGVVLGHAA